MRLDVLAGMVVLGASLSISAAQTDDERLHTVLPRDAIPAIDRPVFEPAATTRSLANREPVIGLVGDREERAYSTWQLDRHEIVNDVFEGRPVAVTWCPLCGTGIVYAREVNGRLLSFGVSGMLYRDALVMYDRETGSLWSQIDGRALKGPLEGAKLQAVPAVHALWEDWRAMYPQSQVLKKGWGETRSAYERYNRGSELGIFGRRNPDSRLPGKTSLLGIEVAGAAMVFPITALRKVDVAQAVVGTTPVVVVAAKGLPIVAFDRRVDGRVLNLTLSPKEPRVLRDTETGTIWQISDGLALSGPLEGRRLTRMVAHTAFWFGWYAFYPQSEVWTATEP